MQKYLNWKDIDDEARKNVEVDLQKTLNFLEYSVDVHTCRTYWQGDCSVWETLRDNFETEIVRKLVH